MQLTILERGAATSWLRCCEALGQSRKMSKLANLQGRFPTCRPLPGTARVSRKGLVSFRDLLPGKCTKKSLGHISQSPSTLNGQ